MPEFFVSPESQKAIQRELSTRQRRFEAARQQVTAEQGERLRYISQLAPTASNELKNAFAVSPMTDEQFQEYAAREAQQRQPEGEGGFLAGVGDVLNRAGMGIWNQLVKPAVRGAFTAWDTVQQEGVLRPLTAAIHAEGNLITNPGAFKQAYDAYGDSAGRNILQGDLATTDEEGNPVEGGSLGMGLLPGGQAQARSQQERTLTIDGHKGDFGRAVAHGIFADEGGMVGQMYQPGDAAYDITAGIAGFFGEVALDPVAWGTVGASALIKSSKGVVGGSRTLGSAIRTISPKMANDAAKQVENYGLVASSTKNTVLAEQATRLFKNRKVLEELAAADEYTIFRRLKLDRLGLGRGDDRLAELITRLGAETDPNEIGRTLIEAAQHGYIRERGFYKGAGKFIPNPKEKFRDFRLGKGTFLGASLENMPEFRYGGISPNSMVTVDNKMEAARDIDGILRLSKVGESDRASIVSRVFRAQDNDEMLDIVGDVVRAQARTMERIGVTREQAAKSVGKNIDDFAESDEIVDILLKTHRTSINEATGYMLDHSTGRPSPPPWAGQAEMTLPDGTVVQTESIKAGFIVNLNKKSIPIPDATDTRRATSKYDATRKIYQSNGWEMGESAARNANKYLFKFPTLFTRFAYPVRNNLENAARIAGAGFASIFSDPRAFFSMGVLDRNKFRDMMVAADGAIDVGRGVRTVDGRYGVVDEIVDAGSEDAVVRLTFKDNDEVIERRLKDFSRDDVAEVFGTQDEWALQTGALTQSASGMWTDDGAKAIGSWRTFRKGEEGDIRAWRSQLGRLANDPIASKVADTAKYVDRDELLDDIIGSGLVDEVSKLGEDARRFFHGSGVAPDRQKVSEYVDWVDGHIDNLTGGDARLRQTIATRDLNGVPFNDVTKGANRRINQILREQYYDRMPAEVMGDTFIEDGPRSKRLWKQATDGIVDFMATRPENHFTRSPLLAQVFADDIAVSMATLASDELRLQLVKRAAEAGYEGKHFDQIVQAAQKASGQKGIATDLDDVIDAAKLHATDKTLNIAFDATQRSSFQEAFDAMVPFWDAFAEIGQSWGRIIRDNPNVLGRGMQVYQGAQGSGFIYTNDMGEEVFAMPGGGALANVLGLNGGKPLFEAPVEGLNLITQGFGPGVGPMVQWAVGAFLPDSPDWQFVRDIATPYGTSVDEPGDLANLPALLGDLRPAWMTKAVNAWTKGEIDPTAWNSTVGDAIKVLGTSGTYDMSNPQEHLRLQKDAEKAARWVTFLRSALQMGAPTGPGVTWEVETDPDGTTHRLGVMASAYYELLKESGDQTTATGAFIELYGVEPFWIAQGKTNELVEGPRTREGLNWIQRHGDAAERHADVVGYFVPAEDPTAPPDYGVFQARMAKGDIESLTGAQQLALANKTKARAMLHAFKARVAELPSGQRRRLESTMRAALTEQFPGWDSDVVGVGGKVDRDREIELLRDAVQDEALADSPVTAPLSAYLQARDRVFEAIAQRGGPTTLGAQDNEDLKLWLYDVGQEIVSRSEDFQGVWQTVLSSEVE